MSEHITPMLFMTKPEDALFQFKNGILRFLKETRMRISPKRKLLNIWSKNIWVTLIKNVFTGLLDFQMKNTKFYIYVGKPDS